jgi:probable phosphoglycerate mutase
LRIYLVRHGQTDSSRDARFAGARDVPLNAVGLQMAEALAEHYAAQPWSGLYASPQLRARQTVGPLARRLGMDVHLDDRLREMEYGEWDGRLSADIAAEDPERWKRWEADPDRNAPPGGETAPQIAARAMAAVDAIRKAHETGDVMVVSHKATIRVLVCALLGLDVGLFRKRIAQRVASVTVFSFLPTGPCLEVLGDLSHLPPGLRAEAT